MTDARDAIDELTAKVDQIRSFYLALRIPPKSFLQGQAVARHLLFARETGAAIVAGLRQGLVLGTDPLVRSLLESVVEMLLIVVWPDRDGGPDGAAARTYASDLRAWKARWEALHEGAAHDPEAFNGFDLGPAEDAEQALERQVRELADAGADAKRLRRAWDEFASNRPNHWSGRETFQARCRFARSRLQEIEDLDEEDADKLRILVNRYEVIWREVSYMAHATPRWSMVHFAPVSDDALEPRLRGPIDEMVAAQAGTAGEYVTNLLAIAALLVRETD